MKDIPFRQIHLDFHTSELIPGIGSRYSKDNFQTALRKGHVDAITVFAKCHHGWCYYPSRVSKRHPNLDFDLLGAMIEDAHELGVEVSVYLSVGYDEKLALSHPEWLIRNRDESLNTTRDFFHPGYHQFCLNSPYLEVILGEIEEALRLYPADGLFLDIVGERECYCANCISKAREEGIDPLDTAAMRSVWRRTYKNYQERVAETAEAARPGIRVFHNSGHVFRNRPDLVDHNSHLELESLPTGGWGYDHFTVSARFVQGLQKPYIGMTGRFFHGWGEFGGYKHPNALRYETSRFLMHGAGCSIGDQLHPFGEFDEGTYRMIGESYADVERKEPWCRGVTSLADIGVLSAEASTERYFANVTEAAQYAKCDIGAVRMLLEEHFLFDVVSPLSDFSRYKLLILPDMIEGSAELTRKIEDFITQGGKVLATGMSGIGADFPDALGMRLPFPVKRKGPEVYSPTYLRPVSRVAEIDADSFVMYRPCQDIVVAGDCETLAFKEYPFFNRSVEHFSSHLHAPGTRDAKTPGIVACGFGIYCAWNIFEEYAIHGTLAAKYVVRGLIERLLGKEVSLVSEHPSLAQITVMHQKTESRFVLHLLMGPTTIRGNGLEIVEDLIPCPEAKVQLKTGKEISRVYLAPEMRDLEFKQADGAVSVSVPSFTCHQMIVFEY